MKRRTRRTLTVAGVLVAVGFAGFLAYNAHGRFEGLINGAAQSNGAKATSPRPALTPPTGPGKVDIGLRQRRGEGSGEGGE